MDGRLYALTKTKTDLDDLQQDPSGSSRSIDKDRSYIDGAVIAPGSLPADALLSHSLTTDYLDMAEVQNALVTKGQVETVLAGEVTSHTHAATHELPVGGTAGQVLSKTDVTDYNVEWADTPLPAEIVTGTAVILTAGWIANTGDYAYKLNLAVVGILAIHDVSAVIEVADFTLASAAQLCPTIESYDGGLTFYAKAVPTAPIQITYSYLEEGTLIDGGSKTLTGLADVPQTYTGNAGKTLVVNGMETGMVFAGNGNAETILSIPVSIDELTGKDGYVLTYDETAGNFSLKVGGGGTSYANAADEPPAIAHAMNDEFDDLVMDNKWSWVNQGTATWEENGKYGKMDLLSGGDHMRLLVQPSPVGDFTVTAKIVAYTPQINYFNVGIVLYNSANGRRILLGKCNRSIYSGIQAVKFTSDTLFSADAYLASGWDSAPSYVRSRIIGNTYYLDASVDGEFWMTLFSETISTFLVGITHVGLGGFRNNTDGKTYAGRYDWFRITQP